MAQLDIGLLIITLLGPLGGGGEEAVFVVDTQMWKLNQSVYTLS